MDRDSIGAEIKETLNHAEDYLQKLREIEEELRIARLQVTESADKAEAELTNRFATFQELLIKNLNERRLKLINDIRSAREEGSTPLSKCRSLVEERIKDTETLILIGKTLKEGKKLEENHLKFFKRHASSIGSLPEVPALKDVPSILFEYDSTYDSELENIMANHGSVSKFPPLQITQMIEKPGSIWVKWDYTDSDEIGPSMEEFCLEKACGNALDHKVDFEKCYQGSSMECLMRDCNINECYSFRVSGKFEGCEKLCRWSLPQKFQTTLKPFTWEQNDAFRMYNSCRIVRPLGNSPPPLFSDGPQLKIGYTIEFTVISRDEKLEDLAHLGIIKDNKVTSLLVNQPDGSFLVNSKGEIKVDGQLRATHFTPFKSGTKIRFDCDCMKDGNVLIHVDFNDKRVSYGWGIDKDDSFYFIAQLPNSSWEIMVE